MKEKKSQCDRILKIQSLRISHKKRSGKNKWLQTFQFLNHSFIHPLPSVYLSQILKPKYSHTHTTFLVR